jgi:hypothetical protein
MDMKLVTGITQTSKAEMYTTRFHDNLHVPIITTTRFKKGAYISGIKIYNHLPQSIKILANDEKSFKFALKRFLYQHSF